MNRRQIGYKLGTLLRELRIAESAIERSGFAPCGAQSIAARSRTETPAPQRHWISEQLISNC
jgi:hypothetical protein